MMGPYKPGERQAHHPNCDALWSSALDAEKKPCNCDALWDEEWARETATTTFGPLKDYDLASRVKDTNPKDAVGTRKVPFSTVPSAVMAEIGLAMLEGARKYGRHNYRAIGVRSSVYYDAAMRHLTAWWEGEDIDPDSGMPHVVKAIASLVVLRDAQINGKCHDDRPPSLGVGWQRALNEKAGEIIDRIPDAKEPYTIDPIMGEGRAAHPSEIDPAWWDSVCAKAAQSTGHVQEVDGCTGTINGPARISRIVDRDGQAIAYRVAMATEGGDLPSLCDGEVTMMTMEHGLWRLPR